MKKRVIIIFLTLLFTILAFGKVDLYAETTDEGTIVEETTLSGSASETEETKEEPEETPQDVEKVEETVEEVKETEQVEDTKETVEEERPQVEDKTEEKSVEESEDQQTVSDAKEPVDQESKEEEITKDEEKAEEKTEEKPEGEVETEGEEQAETEVEEKTDSEGEEKSEVEGETETEAEGGEKVEDSEEAKEAEKTEEETEGETVLEEGEVLEVLELAENPLALGQGQGGLGNPVKVKTFKELKDAITKAGNTPTTIVITESFTITEALTIGEEQDITLTAENNRKEDAWVPVEKPADYAGQGESKQREIIEEGRRRGEDALDKADLEKNPLPSESQDIIIKRADGFTDDTLFKVLGKLTLGTDDKAVYIDGNGDMAQTKLSNSGSVIDVNGELIMKNAVIMNSYNKHGYTGPVRVNDGGSFTMEGGRISKNTSYEQIDAESSHPYAAGAVYVRPGGTFIMKNGLIDNNTGGMTGGVFAGDLWGSKGNPAVIEINGGIIAKNETKTAYQMGAGLAGFPASKITITDGIIAGNYSEDVGGGIAISSRYVNDPVNIYNKESAYVQTDYDKFIKENKAEAKIDGGLIYKNKSDANGGGVFVDSNDVTFGKTMILDNHSSNHGGGIYVSFPPITQKLEHILITENKAEGYTDGYVGGSNGGGIWNCPTGYVHIGDGHSVYVYNNNAGSYGQDITFVKKAWNFELNGKRLGGEFYSHISPVTEGNNIIKYVEDGRGREYGETIPGHLSYHTTYTYLKAIYNDALIKEAWENSETFVLGNKARNGAGLGSNANLITEDKGDYQIEFNKKWDESVDKYHAPTTVWVDLFIVPIDKDGDYVKANYGKDNKLFKYGEVLIREEDGWRARFGANKYNGANKEKVLELLGIKSFTDIGLPENAFNMDKGLPFTADELAARGYKYLVVEQGTGYYVEVSEEKPIEDKTVQAGVIEITREYNDDYDDEFVRKDKDLYFYLYDPEKQVLTRIGQSTIHEDDNTPGTGKTTFAHPILLKKISETKYYGKDRVFTEYLEYGWDGMVGYHNEDKGYAIVLTENEDGTLTVEVPYLWIDDYYGDGFWVKQIEGTEDYEIKGNNAHSFTLTNSNWGQLDVEKSWTNIEEIDQPESMDFYLLLDGKRVIEDYDKDGKPIYKKLTLTAKGKWKGTFKQLNPKALAAGKYTLEENSDIFAPEFINKKEKFIVRIGYANEYHEEGMEENQYTLTNRHFPSENYKNADGTYRDVKLNLYLDGKKIQEGVFHFTIRENPITGAPYAELDKNFAFDAVEVETYGQGIPVKYYDVITNETGRDEYNFYLRKDENGAYALYLPRLVIKGVPYAELFIAYSNEYNETYQRYDPTTMVKPLKADVDWQIKTENHYGPDHKIEFLKEWFGGSNKIPEEITVIVTNEEGEVKEIKLTKEGNWQETIENLKGTLRKHGYTIKEVEVPGFNSDIKTEKAGLKVIGQDKDGKEITLNYVTDELKRILAEGNYRYEVFELSEEDKKKEFNQANLSTFIKVERQKDGRYIIRYAKDVSLTEIFSVNIKNTEVPPDEPRKTYVRVSKVWEALGETASIQVELYVNGEATGRYMTLSEANGWTATFYDLDEYDHLGNRYVYTVREVGDANGIYKLGDREFEVSYAGNMDKGFTITNKEIPPEEPEEPEESDEPEPEEPEEPEEAEDEGGGENIIPKTGVKTDAKSIYLSLIFLIALVVLKRKKYSK
ncbi:Cna B-type domain-containing protein [Ezakiella peruensis]|uniref:Cna B-type domain-containing protein n=1 Tax=Ezakiella peruensis TaxID=1464038 RepID=UPI000C1B38E4|nr:Cna B-type domain-containing protein [Ezakiella peruensis]